MGFEFGIANYIDPETTLYSFIGVVCFVILFDYITGIIEFFLEKSPLYNRMLQIIYKELMLMGLVSFGIIMFEAARAGSEVIKAEAADDHGSGLHSPTMSPTSSIHRLLSGDLGHSISKEESIIIAIDFAHITLFYLTFFFVAHAFYLIWMSIFNEKRYHAIAGSDLSDLEEKIETLSGDRVWKFFFEWAYWPFSEVKNNVEFHLLNDLFAKSYALSLNFNFASYLSISFGRFALQSIHRSLFSWFVLVLIIVINYSRIAVGIACHGDEHMKDFLLETPIDCSEFTIRLFLFAGVLLIIYFTIILFFANLYKQR